MITKTGKYRVKINTPWTVKDEVATPDTLRWPANVKLDLSDFSEVFAPIYKLEDGAEVCLSDLVWREKSGVVKQVQFNTTHIGNNSKVFGTSEACEEWLSSAAQKAQKLMLKENRDSSFQTLKAWANKLNDLEGLSYHDLANIRNGIQTSIKNMERI